ncbi:S41 family peptidase [Sphingomonas aerophila]|uniref:Tail specific protease domain-containing protein n=1 Tax=Sphingomonas aerophila TaxID=1344948 RepID=A0A7W9EU85_9SPHN|nr:S41 family peptidase [Sphingomonas aerophila]MBB5713213.1 hypothetical protein [Sphingomonas aerophila]
MLRISTIVAAILALAISSDGPVPPTRAAKAYFQRALDLIRHHHRNRRQVDWVKLIPQAEILLAGAKRPADTYDAIRLVLAALHERHSFLLDPYPLPASTGATPTRTDAGPLMPSSRLVQSRFGYVRLPELDTLGPNGRERGKAYTATLRRALLSMDRADLCGWIVDLRGNGGGNMWPMLRGLDPLLGAAPFGFFVLPDGTKEAWIRSEGSIFSSSDELPPSQPLFELAHSAAPVAVLIGRGTASSGEMTALAFVGRPRTRVFGAASAGFTTANMPYILSDGAVLLITETSVRDRTGRDYVGSIEPDEHLEYFNIETGAQRWLASQCAR